MRSSFCPAIPLPASVISSSMRSGKRLRRTVAVGLPAVILVARNRGLIRLYNPAIYAQNENNIASGQREEMGSELRIVPCFWHPGPRSDRSTVFLW